MDDSRPTISRKRVTMLLALIATIGLVICASVFYINQSTKKQLADSAETTDLKQTAATTDAAAVTTAAVPASAEPAEENKEIFIDHAQVQEAPKKVTTKRFRNHSRNSIAMKFPAPPVKSSASNMTSANGGEVEMWAGDKRTFVSVPPGTKFED